MVEVDHEIKWVEQKKRKIEDELEDINGQLNSLKRKYKEFEKKNMRLKAAHVKKLKFSPQKAEQVKQSRVVKTSVDQDRVVNTKCGKFSIDNMDIESDEDLVNACKDAEVDGRSKVVGSDRSAL